MVTLFPKFLLRDHGVKTYVVVPTYARLSRLISAT